jgi:hypothetical protein
LVVVSGDLTQRAAPKNSSGRRVSPSAFKPQIVVPSNRPLYNVIGR